MFVLALIYGFLHSIANITYGTVLDCLYRTVRLYNHMNI